MKTSGLIAFLFAAAAALVPQTRAAEVDVSKLPPPANRQVDFAADIKPILDTACIRCHGAEKPKSGFRLDTREAALKGGQEGVDIVPGKSAESPLIHYVARLVPDMEMPPEGKGDPLSNDQIGLLRAWIDQGVQWTNAAPTNLFDVTFSPVVHGTFIAGDSHKFREHYWRRDGADGGVENFELFKQLDPNTTVQASGHATLDDYKLTLSAQRRDLGFIRSGWTEFRKYYDDTGGYLPGPDARPRLSLDRDLYLDRGRAWIDFGLTLPHWPRMVLGYEYAYRLGDEATTAWGSDLFPDGPHNIAPTSKHIDETVHIIKFDLDAEYKGVTIEDRFRGEFYDLNTHYTNVAARASVTQDAGEHNSYFQGANSVRLEKQFTGWLFGSGGYFYSKLDADDTFTNAVVADDTLYLAQVPNIELSRETHLFNLNGLLGPFDGLTISAGAQSEWTRQHGFGEGDLHGIQFVRFLGDTLTINPAKLAADYDQNTVTEMAGIRYTKIPYTSLFGDARLKQETIEQRESDIQENALSFLENPTHTTQLTDLRGGFHTSPIDRVSLSSHYRWYKNDSRYRTNDLPQPEGGYPGFLRWRNTITDEVEAKLVVRMASWLKTTFSYQIVSTKYEQENRPGYDIDPITIYSPGGYVLAGKYDAHIYSFGSTITPLRRLAITTTFSYQDSTITTEGGGLLPPYEGGVYSAMLNTLYILNKSTDLSLNYVFSLGDYSQPVLGETSPPPVGIRYQQHALRAGIARRINKNITTRLQYGFYHYDEPTLAGYNDYDAHSIFATLICRIP